MKTLLVFMTLTGVSQLFDNSGFITLHARTCTPTSIRTEPSADFCFFTTVIKLIRPTDTDSHWKIFNLQNEFLARFPGKITSCCENRVDL